MSKAIAFPRIEPRWLFDRESVSFFALANNNVVRCLVSSEALYSRFGAQDFSQHEVVRAFKENRETIEQVARRKIEEGDYRAGDEILLRMDDFGPQASTTTTTPPKPRMHNRAFFATYKKDIVEHHDAYDAAQEATAVLREEMALGAEPVMVIWDLFPMPEQPLISLAIQDNVNHLEVTRLYTIDDLSNTKYMRFAMFQVWDELLRERINKRMTALKEDTATEEVK